MPDSFLCWKKIFFNDFNWIASKKIKKKFSWKKNFSEKKIFDKKITLKVILSLLKYLKECI